MGSGDTETRTKGDSSEERFFSNDQVSNLTNGHRVMQMKVLYSVLSSLFLRPSRPLLLGDFYILYRPSPIIWALHLLIIQIPTWAHVPSDTLINSLWVVMAKVALFRGLLFINAVRRVVVKHLMWWWQTLLRYFGSPSFLRIRGMDYSGWDAPLTWILECPRRNYSSDMFSLTQWAWVRILGHDVSSDGSVLGRTRGPVNPLFWAGSHNYHSKIQTNHFRYNFKILWLSYSKNFKQRLLIPKLVNCWFLF